MSPTGEPAVTSRAPGWFANLNQRDRRAVVICATVVGVLVLARFVVMPMVHFWSEARGRIEAKHEEVHALSAKLDKWKFERDLLAPDYGAALDAPPLAAEEVRLAFLKTLQDTLASGGMQVQSIRPLATRPVKELTGVSIATFQVTAKCQFAQLAPTLANLAAAPNLMLIDRLSMDVDEGQPGMLTVMLQIGTLTRSGGKR